MKKNQDHLGFENARGLLVRLQDGAPFRNYLEDRLRLVVPALALFALVSMACAGATAVFFADLSSWLTLPGFLLAPAVLAGSLFVQGLVFLSWLERRALALALGHQPRGGMRELPQVPWPLAAGALFVPLLFLAILAPIAALVLVGLGALVPFAFVRLERALGMSRLTRSRAAV